MRLIPGSGVNVPDACMKSPKSPIFSRALLQRSIQSDERPERALRIGRAFRVGRRAWQPCGDGYPSFPLAALMQIDVQIKTVTPMRNAHFHGRSLSFGQTPHFEPRLTKSD